MTQEEKQLLLKDLCARLPYNPYILIEGERRTVLSSVTIYQDEYAEIWYEGIYYDIEDCKPYLRPMSSMTEEEKDELCRLCDFKQSYDDRDYFTHYGIEVISEYCVNGKKIPESVINYSVIDFFYEHHLDWRGLIPMGLALEAKEGMYKTE